MNHNWKRLIWLILLSIFISACIYSAPVSVSTASPCTPGNNSYRDSVEPKLILIYENGASFINDAIKYSDYQRLAFGELVNYVYDFSDSVDFDLGEKTVRITITYINRQLAHAVLVNHYLYKRNVGFAGRLNDQIKEQMSGIVDRNEDVFFITFIAFDNTNNIIDNSSTNVIYFPIGDLRLTNTGNTLVNKQHDDQNLENQIILKNGLEYGFFYYPMAVIHNETCQTVLNENRDTRFVLGVPKITIDEQEVGPGSWEYKYAPLMNVKADSFTPIPRFPDTMSLSIDQIVPQVPQSIPKSLDDSGFWISLARIIWLETTLDP